MSNNQIAEEAAITAAGSWLALIDDDNISERKVEIQKLLECSKKLH